MQYNQPYGVSDPNAVYVNGNPATGLAGSIPPAASIEYPQRELVNFFTDCGLTPANTDLQQLAKSVQTAKVIYGVDSGAANIMSIALNPPLDAYYDGLFVWVMVANTNTGPATLQINGLAGRNVVRRGGAALQAGDCPANYKSLFCYNAIHTNFELYGVGFAPITGFMPILTANTVLYVNGTTGSDTLYDGTTATVSGPHGPFKTIGRAMNETFKYGPSVYTMTIQVAAGTYNEAVSTPTVVGPTVIINGAGITSTFVVADPGNTFVVGNGNTMFVQNLCAYANGPAGPLTCFGATGTGTLYTNNTASNNCLGYVFSSFGGAVFVGNHTFNAGTSCWIGISVAAGGLLYFNQGATFNFNGSFLATDAFAVASTNGMMECGNPPYQPVFNNVGGVSAVKFRADVNGVIDVQGLSVNLFPGNIAGYTQRGGWYV